MATDSATLRSYLDMKRSSEPPIAIPLKLQLNKAFAIISAIKACIINPRKDPAFCTHMNTLQSLNFWTIDTQYLMGFDPLYAYSNEFTEWKTLTNKHNKPPRLGLK